MGADQFVVGPFNDIPELSLVIVGGAISPATSPASSTASEIMTITIFIGPLVVLTPPTLHATLHQTYRNFRL